MICLFLQGIHLQGRFKQHDVCKVGGDEFNDSAKMSTQIKTTPTNAFLIWPGIRKYFLRLP
jgi:hypothetical protein